MVKGEYDVPHQELQGNYSVMFCDKQDKQIISAKKLGVTPQENTDSILVLLIKRELVLVLPCRYYMCIASMPFLTPKAADLLAEIGRRYQNNIGSKWEYPLVTSCFRTKNHIKTLQKTNANAVTNSCHLYGTTFDISYSRMNDRQRNAMAQALRDLQMAGYCYVKYEINQPCFHITIRQ